jgi:hypothetical protein
MPNLLLDVGLVVLNIDDDVNVLLCKVCCVYLQLDPCEVHTHLLVQANHWLQKQNRKNEQQGEQFVASVPFVAILTSFFQEVGITVMQDHHLEKYTTSSILHLLLVVLGIIVINGHRCKVGKCVYYCALKRTMINHRSTQHAHLSFDDVYQHC